MIASQPLWKNLKQTYQPVTGTLKTDILIIGGGIAGVSAAFYLSGKRHKVALIEKGLMGEGTSVGTGILQPGLDMDFKDIIRKFGVTYAKRIFSSQQATLNEIKRVALLAAPNCDFEQKGSLTVALTDSDLETLKTENSSRQSLGIKCKYFGSKAVNRMINSAKVKAALYSPYEATFNQVEFIKGLTDYVSRRGVLIFEKTPALKVQKRAKIYRVATGRGEIQAKMIIWTAGPGNLKFIPKRIKLLGIKSYVIATACLDKKKLSLLNWKLGNILWSLGFRYWYLRLTPDQRIILGGEDLPFQGHISEKSEARRFAALKKLLIDLFPQLSNVKIDFQWSGIFWLAKDRLPVIGKTGNEIYTLAYSGNGILASFHSGRRAAKYARSTL